MKHLLCLLLTVFLLAAASSSCAEQVSTGLPAINWYEIFVYSYADSDGDGIGDLQGLIERLDYLEDMGYNGLWLMPIMPSPSYHKYDVTDYKAIDPQYGTMDDFRQLVDQCHQRGIRIIIDLPLNHSSTQHPWFLAACDAIRAGHVDDPAARYYHWSQAETGNTWVPLGNTGWRYEEQFSGGQMPDLNLDDSAVRDEIRGILTFWLDDVGIDGFRLDAVTSYYTKDAERNVEFLSWLKNTCESIRPGSYLVGECWAGLNEIAQYYTSGVDSFFLFPASQAEGWVVKTMLSRKPAEAFAKYFRQMQEKLPNVRVAPFLGNHDTGRAIGSLQARTLPDRAKFAEAVLSLFGGDVFTYYGEEIGMVGSGDDPNKRTAMYWNAQDLTRNPPGTTKAEYAYPSVEEQQQDSLSLLNYCKALNHLKLSYPAMTRGEAEIIYHDTHTLLIRRSSPDQTVLLAVNLSSTDTREIPLETNCTMANQLNVGMDQALLTDHTLLMPPYSLAILIPD